MKRLLYSFLIAFAASLTASAKSVVFTLTDGTLVYYLLDNDNPPIMKFIDGGVTVNADKYAFSGFKHFYISDTDDPNAIEGTEEQKTTLKGNILTLDAAKAKSVKVYDAAGAAVNATVTKNAGALIVDLQSLATGTYIVKTSNSSFKVYKK